MIDDADLLAKLKTINRELTALYPLNDQVDARIAITIGWLIGACRECIDAVSEDRNLRLARLRGGDQ